jgi:hypothetical protein
MSAAESLDDAILDDLADVDLDNEPPTLATIDEADRTVWHIARLERQATQNEELAKLRKAQVDAWLEDVNGVLERERAWRERQVEGWMRAHHETTGTKSVRLPSGTLALRKPRPRVEVLAEPSEDAPAELVRVKRDWDKVAIGKGHNPGPEVDGCDPPEGFVARTAVNADGVPMEDFVLLVPVQASFSIKTGGA